MSGTSTIPWQENKPTIDFQASVLNLNVSLIDIPRNFNCCLKNGEMDGTSVIFRLPALHVKINSQVFANPTTSFTTRTRSNANIQIDVEEPWLILEDRCIILLDNWNEKVHLDKPKSIIESVRFLESLVSVYVTYQMSITLSNPCIKLRFLNVNSDSTDGTDFVLGVGSIRALITTPQNTTTKNKTDFLNIDVSCLHLFMVAEHFINEIEQGTDQIVSEPKFTFVMSIESCIVHHLRNEIDEGVWKNASGSRVSISALVNVEIAPIFIDLVRIPDSDYFDNYLVIFGRIGVMFQMLNSDEVPAVRNPLVNTFPIDLDLDITIEGSKFLVALCGTDTSNSILFSLDKYCLVQSISAKVYLNNKDGFCCNCSFYASYINH